MLSRGPTIRGSTSFRGDSSISQLDGRKFFRLDILLPSGDPALGTKANCFFLIFEGRDLRY